MCSKAGSFVVDLYAPACLHLSFLISKIPCFLLVPFPILISICVVGNNTKACHTLCHHILVLEPDIDIFTEVLDLVVEIPTLDQSCLTINNFNSPPPKHLKRNLVCEQVYLYFKFYFLIFLVYVSMSWFFIFLITKVFLPFLAKEEFVSNPPGLSYHFCMWRIRFEPW